jgi:hypothetical protein
MDKQDIKNSLKGKLPRGFTGTIQTRLSERGINLSKPMISKVCASDKPNWNNDIIVEALKLANEETEVLSSIQEKAATL